MLHRGPHVVLTVALALALLGAPIATATTLAPSSGDFVSSSDTDYVPTLMAEGNQFIVRYDKDANGDLTDDCFYLVSNAAATSLSVGDYRIGGDISNCNEGEFLTSSSTELTGSWPVEELDGTTGSADNVNTLVKYLELDGIQGFTPGDGVYIDLPANVEGTNCDGGAGSLSLCDLRLTAITVGSSLPFGSIVETGSNADLTEAGDVDGTLPDTATFVDFTDAEVTFHYRDVNQDGNSNSGDALHLRAGRAATAQEVNLGGAVVYAAMAPMAMEIRLTSASGTIGTMVAPGNSIHLPYLQAAPTITNRPLGELVAIDPDNAGLDGDLTDDELYIHWGGTVDTTCAAAGTRLQHGDMLLNTVNSQTAGTFVTTTATGLGDVVDATSCEGVAATTGDLADFVYAVDLNSNGRFDEGDGLYLHRNTKIGGSTDTLGLTEHDVRLTSVSFNSCSGCSVGSRVKASDPDLTTFSGQKMSLTFTLKWNEANGGTTFGQLRYLDAAISGADGTLAAGEMAYAVAGTSVINGAIRINGFTATAGAAVAAGHFDVGRTTLDVANAKVADLGTANDAYDVGEAVYISADAAVSDGDIRLTVVTPYAIGSTVSCTGTVDTDCTLALEDPETWGTAQYIRAIDTDGDATLEPTEDIYYIHTVDDAAVVATEKRITPVTLTAGSTASCSSATAKDDDCGSTLQDLTNAKITGSDITYTHGTDEVYVSADYAIGVGDTRVTEVGPFNGFTGAALSTVALPDPDVAQTAVDSADALYLSPTSLTGAANSAKIPVRYDVRLLPYTGESIGTFVNTGDQDFSPRFLPLASMNIGRWDAGNTGSKNDDGFYATTSSGDNVGVAPGDIRLVGIVSKVSGTRVQGGDVDDVSGTFTDITASVALKDAVKFVDGPSSKRSGAFDSEDQLIIETNAVGGSSSGTDIDAFDVRGSDTKGLSTTYQAGTIVFAADKDSTTYASYTSHPAGTAFQIKFLDRDADGAYDATGSDNAKIEHVLVAADASSCATATPCSMLAREWDVLLSGDGGSGSTTPSTPPSTPSSTPSTPPSTPSTPPSTPTSPTTPTTPPAPPIFTDVDVSNANIAIASSLTVTRSEDTNLLSWNKQNAVAGYDIWSANSPFVFIGETGPDTTTFTDSNGQGGTKYLVTAFFNNPDKQIGRATTMDGDKPNLPGMNSVEPAEAPADPKKESSPGAGLILALAAVAVAFLARRRQ